MSRKKSLTFIISCNQIWASYLLLFSKTTLAVTVHTHTHNFGMHKPINFITKYRSWGCRRTARQKVLKCKVCVCLKGCHLLHTSAFKKNQQPLLLPHRLCKYILPNARWCGVKILLACSSLAWVAKAWASSVSPQMCAKKTCSWHEQWEHPGDAA